MKSAHYKFLLLLPIFAFTACEMLVDFELPDQEPKLVLFSYYETGTDEMILFIGNSSGITTTDPYQYISNADVQIFVNDQPVANAQFLLNFPDQEFPGSEFYDFKQSVYIANLNSIELEAGDEFKVIVNAPGFETLIATDVVPVKSPMINLEYRHHGALEPISSDPLDQYILRISDQGNNTNYYTLEGQISFLFMSEDSTQIETSMDYISFRSRGLTAEPGYNGPVFNNAGRIGSTFDIEFTSYAAFDTSSIQHIEVKLLNISEDRFLFEKSMLIVSNTSGNPFAEPAFLHSNVIGGYGFLSVYHGHALVLYP